MASLSIGGPQAHSRMERSDRQRARLRQVAVVSQGAAEGAGGELATSCSGRRASARGAGSTATATPRTCGAISRASSPASTRASAQRPRSASRRATPARATTLDGRGSSNVETGHVAGYGGWGFGQFNLRAGGAFAWHTIDTSRAIVFPGFFDTRDRELQRPHRADLRRGRLRLCVRQRRGRAVRRCRMGAPQHRRVNERGDAAALERRGEHVRGRLLDARRTRRQHDPDRPRHGAGAARVRRLAACVQRCDAGGAARLPSRRRRRS